MADMVRYETTARPFVVVYYDILDDDCLSRSDLLLYIALKRYAGKADSCFPGIPALARAARMSERQVQYTLKSLQDKGYLNRQERKDQNGGNTSNLYIVYGEKRLNHAETENETIDTVLDRLVSESDRQNRGKLAERAKKLLSESPEKKQSPVFTAINTGSNSENHIKNCAITNIQDANASCQVSDAQSFIADANGEQMAAQSGATKAKHQDAEAQSGAAKTGAKDRPGKSRATEYTMAYLRDKYDYHILRADTDINKTQLDYTLQIIYDTLNSTQKTIRVQGQDKPTDIVKSQLLGLNYAQIKYVIEKYNQQTSRITNTRGYILSMLYVAKGQQQADVSNRVRADGVI